MFTISWEKNPRRIFVILRVVHTWALAGTGIGGREGTRLTWTNHGFLPELDLPRLGSMISVGEKPAQFQLLFVKDNATREIHKSNDIISAQKNYGRRLTELKQTLVTLATHCCPLCKWSEGKAYSTTKLERGENRSNNIPHRSDQPSLYLLFLSLLPCSGPNSTHELQQNTKPSSNHRNLTACSHWAW